MSAGEVANRFTCSWPTTTRHLRVLEAAELLKVDKRGRERVYRLQADHLLEVTSRWLGSFRTAKAAG
jgi:DNA-binding transcriptional ArsR family regulator